MNNNPTCRVCLSSDPDLIKYVSLFKSYRNAAIYQHIMAITKVTISEQDGMPEKICPNCLTELETAVNFKEKCEASEQILCSKKNFAEEDSELKSESEIAKKEEIEEEFRPFDDDFDNVDNALSEQNADTFEALKEVRLSPFAINGKSFMCTMCRRIFKSELSMKRHIGICQKNFEDIAIPFTVDGEGSKRKFVCSKCKYSTRVFQHFKKHSVRHSGAKPHKCEFCPKAYTQTGNLKLHIETIHKKISPIPCDICGKDFKSRTHLLTHLKTHLKERYQCDTCKRYFKSKKILGIHMTRHSDTKTFTCEMCAANFFTLAELCSHRKRHAGIKKEYRFECLTCNRKYRDKFYLLRHMQRHESGKHYCCEICGRFFDTQQNLEAHKKLHSRGYKCVYCSKLFIKKFSLTRHLENKHGIP